MTRLTINLGLPTAPRKNEVGAVVTVTVIQPRPQTTSERLIASGEYYESAPGQWTHKSKLGEY